jgi:hypothetical protein
MATSSMDVSQLQLQLQEKDQRISQLQSLVEIAFSGQADKHVASPGWIEEVRAALSGGANSDEGKATRALQSSLADAKVEVEFWKRKVDDLSTRLTESQIEKRRLEESQKASAASAKQQGVAQHASSSSSSDERLRIGALELQLKTLLHSVDVHTSKALHVKTCVSNTVTRLALKVADAHKQQLLSHAWGAWVLMTSVQRGQKKLNRVLDLSRHKHVFSQLRLAAVVQKAQATGIEASAALAPSAPANRSDDIVKGTEPKHENNLELLYVHSSL